jgi:hypothetical protein
MKTKTESQHTPTLDVFEGPFKIATAINVEQRDRIVCAVNAHEPMLKALIEVRGILKLSDSGLLNYRLTALNAIDTALAKAEGK